MFVSAAALLPKRLRTPVPILLIKERLALLIAIADAVLSRFNVNNFQGKTRNVMAGIDTKLDPKEFTDFGVNSFQDPRAINVLKSLQQRLELVEKQILQRNQRREEFYPGFLPSRMANSTSG